MNIAFVIFNLRVGKGGHSFSLNATASTLSSEFDSVKIIDISNNDSFILASTEGANYVRLSFNNLIVLLKKLKVEISSKFNVIHCFDDFSYILVRMAFWGEKLPVVLTKCGGGNPQYYYPYSDFLVCYSKENHSFFKSNIHYPNVELLPNRLLVQDDYARTDKLHYINDFGINILCISRISDYYEAKIRQSINLLNLLVEKNIIASLTIMGTIEDSDLFARCKILAGDSNVFFLTEDFFTKKASAYISYFDCIIGTGRGFMEGAIANKLMFVPTSNSKYPSLVEAHNVDEYATVNFSERGVGESDGDKIFSRLIRLIEDKGTRDSYDLFIKEYSQENFLIEGVKTKYLELYRRAIVKPNRFKFVNFSLGLMYFLYRIFSFKYNFKNSFFKN